MRCTTPKPSDTNAPSIRPGADEFDQRLGQRQPLGVVLAGLARVEADVLQQQHVAVGQALRPGERVGADDVAGELDVPAQLLAERRRDGRERELRIGSALGPAEVGGHDDLGARRRPAPSASAPRR